MYRTIRKFNIRTVYRIDGDHWYNVSIVAYCTAVCMDRYGPSMSHWLGYLEDREMVYSIQYVVTYAARMLATVKP